MGGEGWARSILPECLGVWLLWPPVRGGWGGSRALGGHGHWTGLLCPAPQVALLLCRAGRVSAL